jgi:hypothetical protein
MSGRVFGTVYTGASLAKTLTYAVGGVLLEATPPRVVFVIAGCRLLLPLGQLGIMLPRGADESVAAL